MPKRDPNQQAARAVEKIPPAASQCAARIWRPGLRPHRRQLANRAAKRLDLVMGVVAFISADA